MRENTKWIMLVTFLAFVGLMVFEWGMDLSGRSGAAAAGGELGRVNGEPITYEDFLAVYRNLYQQQLEAAEGVITPSMNRQIEDAAWDQLVTQILLEQELRRRGIRVTDDEIRQAALYAPPPELQSAPTFQTDGQFDPVKYQQFLASPALDEQFLRQLEAYYRDIIPRSKLFFQNAAGLYMSDAQLWRMWKDAGEMATVRYVAFLPDALVPDEDVTVTDQAIREHYNRNRDNYLRPAQASVRYVALDRTVTAADSAAARQRAAGYRDEILGGASFTDVAERAAEATTGAGRFYGEEFTVREGESAPALDAAYFNTPVGQLSEPVLSPSGYHIVRVEARTAGEAQVRQILVPITLSDEAEDRLLDRADSLEMAADRAGLDQAATQMGLQVRTAELTPALPILPGIGSVEDGLDWVFNEAGIGEVSPVLENDQSFYVMELVTRRDEGPLSLQEATPTIRAYLVQRAKMERARERLADAERRARAGEPLEQIAAAHGATVEEAGPFGRGDFVPGLGRLNAAIGAAFGIQPGETTPLIEANNQLYLVRSVALEEADVDQWRAQLPGQRGRVVQALSDARWNQFMVALREDAKIVDNRAQVMRQTATNGR